MKQFEMTGYSIDMKSWRKHPDYGLCLWLHTMSVLIVAVETTACTYGGRGPYVCVVGRENGRDYLCQFSDLFFTEGISLMVTATLGLYGWHYSITTARREQAFRPLSPLEDVAQSVRRIECLNRKDTTRKAARSMCG